jgi:hypothetical protein
MSPGVRKSAKAADPDQRIAQLEKRRDGLARKRYELGDVEKTQQLVVAGATERRLAVRLAGARGESPPETVEEVEADRHRAETQLAGAREEGGALRQVEKEIADEIEAVEASDPAFFWAKAVAQAKGTLAKLADVLQTVQAVEPDWRETAKQVTRYRSSCDRRRVPKPSELPISDLGSAINDVSKAKGTLERYLRNAAAQEAAERNAGKLSNAEAIARFAGEAA